MLMNITDSRLKTAAWEVRAAGGGAAWVMVPLIGALRPPGKAPSVGRFVLLQEGDHGLEHLQTRLAARQPVVLARQSDELDRLAGPLQGVGHQAALFEGHHGVVLAVNEQDRALDRADMRQWRDGGEVGIACAVHAHEPAPELLRSQAVLAPA